MQFRLSITSNPTRRGRGKRSSEKFVGKVSFLQSLAGRKPTPPTLRFHKTFQDRERGSKLFQEAEHGTEQRYFDKLSTSLLGRLHGTGTESKLRSPLPPAPFPLFDQLL
jgi:hypothetical protein